jgi:type I restriction-modification system DNA methylase subunit
MAKKKDCGTTTAINEIIHTAVAETAKELVRTVAGTKPEITKETLPAFFEDLHNLLWNKAGLNPERALEHMTFFFAYRLIEQQADTLSLPQECRWTYIASLKNENDLFETIKKGVTEFRKKQKTKAFFKPHEIQKADIVFEIVQQINRISLTILQETDTLGDIFEYMLGRGMSTMSDEGQYFTNRAICKLAFKLAYDIKKTLRRADGSLCTFADWFCGTGGFPAEYVKGVKANLKDVDWKKDSGSVYCQDMNLSSVTTTLLNMLILTGIPFNGDKIRGSNSFTDAITTGSGAPFTGLTVDYSFMNPPYGGDKSKGKEYKFAYSKEVKGEDGVKTKKFFVNQEIQSIGIEDDDKVSAGVQLGMATISTDGGVCSIVLPQGFFFGASKKCVELRKKIAEEYKIHYVVDIASGSFLNTGTKTSMMIFQKGVGATEKVSFIGLDEKPLVTATLTELRAKHYSLNYKQYLPQSAVEVEGFEMVKLGDICYTKNGFAIKSENMTKNTSDYPVIKVKNLNDGVGRLIDDNDRINIKLKDEFIVKKGDVLIVMVGNTAGKMAVWEDKDAYLNQNVHKIHFKEKAVPRYVYYILNSPALMEQILPLSSGTAQPFISPSSLYEIQIPLPSLERQAQIVEAIDGWATLAQQEEVALKILEKQMMFQVKEMGRGQARVKLGEVCEIESGTYITKKTATEGDVPVYGGGDVSSRISEFNRDSKFVIAKDGVSETCVRYVPGKFFLNHHGWTFKSKDNALYHYVGYWLLNNQHSLYELATGTAQKGINQVSFYSLEIPLPPLTEQQTLQSDFDEIRHKHAKIAEYKANAQEAIQRLIPGAAPKYPVSTPTESEKEDTFALTSTTNEVVSEPVATEAPVAKKRAPIPIGRKKTTTPSLAPLPFPDPSS